jgi:predicted nucleic acid-binding protein
MGNQNQNENLAGTSKKLAQKKSCDKKEKIKKLKELVQSGFYNSEEVIEKVVRKLAEEI